MRKIIHVDMDCFYAAVEMRENPSLVGKPIAVVIGEPPRSVVSTCNYVARGFGVHSAMSGSEAKKKCPQIRCIPVRMEIYEQVSKEIREIFFEYTSKVEPLSLDEAYLDVTDSGRFACDIAKEIRARIFEEIKLTASAGIAQNKMLAKIASDWKKPNGQHVILPAQVPDFMLRLPVKKIPGIGPKTAKTLKALGVHTCEELQRLTLPQLAVEFGKPGVEIYHRCRGVDEREVESDKRRKSLSVEKTFSNDLATLRECETAIDAIAEGLLDKIRRRFADREVHTAFVTLKFSDLTTTEKQRACGNPSKGVFNDLLADAYGRSPLPIRLLGTGVRFVDEDQDKGDNSQMEFFT